MPAPTVFISYSHDSSEHAERVRGLGASLARDGFECRIDAYKETDEDWPTWMSHQLVEADFVLCVVTEIYERRFRDNELPDAGLGVGWEAGLIRRLLYGKKLRNDRIFPIVFARADRDRIPLELQGYDFFILDGPDGYEALLRKLQKRPLHAAPDVGVGPVLITTTTAPLFARPGIAMAASSATAIPTDVSRILEYAPAELIGREHELNLLTAAWKGDLQGLAAYPVIRIKHCLKVLSFVAFGGEGKTSLVAKWAAELAVQGWPGCDAAFAWSFYSQGTRDQTAASSDLFLKEALLFFAASEEDKQFAASNAGAFEKGQHLARIIGGRRCLLILDGLEPLQYAPTSPTPGELKDQGIAALLKGLAQNNHGLCIVTTRYSLPDLKAFWQTSAPEVKLLRLSCDAGVHLLKTLDVNGTAKEFETLVEDVKGHALTLTLIGGFLRRAFHGDIRQRDRVKFEKADEKIDGGHAFRTMAAYEQWLLRDGGEEGRREVAVLRLMGLFDRPADTGCLAALRRETISGLTEPLAGLADDDWEYCLSGLETANLLTVNRDASGVLVSLDAHPHLREYFAGQLRTQQPDAWRAAHRRLYEHLCATTNEGEHPTLEDLQPLYQAVAHGCQAGLEQEACSRVYRDRLQRGQEAYSTKKLGALGSDLGAIACFFAVPWSRPLPLLAQADQGYVLDEAGYTLRALSRLIEARNPMRAAIEIYVKLQNWKDACIAVGSLSEFDLTLGDIGGAIRNGARCVEYADHSGDAYRRMTQRTTYADALHQAGRRAEAEGLFRKAEEMQVERQFDSQLLKGLAGFEYCDLLLAAPEHASWQQTLSLNPHPSTLNLTESCRSVSQRAAMALEIVLNGSRNLLDIALNHLTLGRAALYMAILDRSAAVSERPDPAASFSQDHARNSARPSAFGSETPALHTAGRELDDAVTSLHRADQQQYLPLGLLTRAWCFFAEASAHKLRGDAQEAARLFSRAQEDLDEAWEIAERGPMKLFLADIHLYRARLFGRPNADSADRKEKMPYPWESSQADLAAAEKLINDCGYHRRDEELADAKAAILSK
jgi:tetratricopeptide (TPR) repeat protein